MEKHIVFIEWMDHYEDTGWQDLDTYKVSNIICTSIGFLVKENKDYYSITTTLTPDNQAGNVMNIMKKNVKQFYFIEF